MKSYLGELLGTDALPAAPGVFYAFKAESRRQQFIANRFRRREILPRKRISERQFEEQRAILEPLMAAVATLGRLPEIPGTAGATPRFLLSPRFPDMLFHIVQD